MNKILTADWCSSCKELKRELQKLGIIFKEINAETEIGANLILEYSIRSLPTLITNEVVVSGKESILEVFMNYQELTK